MDEQIIDLREYVKIIIEKWKMVIVFTAIAGVISVVYAIVFVKGYYKTYCLIEPAKIANSALEPASRIETLFKNPVNPILKKVNEGMGLPEASVYSLAKMFAIEDKEGYYSVITRAETPDESMKLANVVCQILIERQNDLMKDMLEIANNEMVDLETRLKEINDELVKLEKSTLEKEKTRDLAQAYVFQSLIQAKQGTISRLVELKERIKARKTDLKYYTKPASMVAAPYMPMIKEGTPRRKVVLNGILIGFLISLLLVLLIEYFKGERGGQ